MKKSIENKIRGIYQWYERNLAKIVFIFILHSITSYLVEQPYINIFTGKNIPYLLDWIAFMVFFRPSKYIILRSGLFFLLVTIIFAIFRIYNIEELLGQIIYVTIATFVLLSLFDNNNKV